MSRLSWRHYGHLLLALSTALGLSACTRGTADLQRWVAQQQAKKGTLAQPTPGVKTFETFQYNDENQRDPFSASKTGLPSSAGTSTGVHPDENRPKQPLEAFALDSLRMVGTITANASMQALIKDPDGTIYRVREGDYMGQNDGRITAIGEARIDLMELIPDGNGGWMERPTSMALTEK